MSTAPLEIYSLGKTVTCLILILPAENKHTCMNIFQKYMFFLYIKYLYIIINIDRTHILCKQKRLICMRIIV